MVQTIYSNSSIENGRAGFADYFIVAFVLLSGENSYGRKNRALKRCNTGNFKQFCCLMTKVKHFSTNKLE